MSLALAGAVMAGGRPLVANMTGTNEFPGPGDPDGTGTARLTLNQGQGQICFTITVQNITLPATAAHIHPGTAGTANPPIVSLAPPDATGNSSGCATGVSKALVKAIRQNPAAYYVNVHTTDFPGGAVRGQLATK
ncbi:MAG: CHRD domain-containing protein [Candidatus Limnocylindrales bacterium]